MSPGGEAAHRPRGTSGPTGRHAESSTPIDRPPGTITAGWVASAAARTRLTRRPGAGSREPADATAACVDHRATPPSHALHPLTDRSINAAGPGTFSPRESRDASRRMPNETALLDRACKKSQKAGVIEDGVERLAPTHGITRLTVVVDRHETPRDGALPPARKNRGLKAGRPPRGGRDFTPFGFGNAENEHPCNHFQRATMAR